MGVIFKLVKTLRVFITFLFLFSVLLSCSQEIGDTLSANYQINFVSVTTIPEGAVLSGDLQLPVSLFYDSDLKESPDRLSIRVSNRETGEEVVSYNYLYDEGEDSYQSVLDGEVASVIVYDPDKFLSLESFDDLNNRAEVDYKEDSDQVSDPEILSEDSLSSEVLLPVKEAELLLIDITDDQIVDADSPLELTDEVVPSDDDYFYLEEPSESSYDIIIEIPEQEDGRYDIELTFFHNEQRLGVKTVPFFFSKTPVFVDSLEIYPLVVYPGGEALALIESTVVSPDVAWMKVLFGNKEIAAGHVSDIGDILRLRASEEEGVYSFRVEIFPFAPGYEEGDYFFSSPYFLASDVFVSSKQRPRVGELLGDEQFSVLHHFRGEMVNRGNGQNPLLLSNPLLDMANGFFGYRFNADSQLFYDFSVLPLEEEQLLPFSLQVSTHFPLGQSGPVFSTKGSNFSLVLKVLENRLPALSLYLNGETFESIVPSVLDPEDFSFRPLTVSVFPWKKSTLVLWYKDGQLISRDEFPFQLLGIKAPLQSILGGTHSFSGIIDEFGIFTQNQKGDASIQESLFKDAMSSILKGQSIFTEGFDSLYDSEYSFDCKGSYELSGSRLEILPQSTWTQVVNIEGLDRLNVEIDLMALPNSTAVLSVQGLSRNRPIDYLSFDFSLLKVLVQNEASLGFESDGVIQFTIHEKDGQLVCLLGEFEFTLDGNVLPDELLFTIDNPVSSSGFILNGIVVDSNETPVLNIEYRPEIKYSL